MRAGEEQHSGARLAVGVAYVLAMVGVAALAAWPIYRSAAFVLLVVVATATGCLIAGASLRFGWPRWLTAAVTVAAILTLGLPLAVPSRLSSMSTWGQGLVEVLTGAVTGWKDLITAPLPVGSYRNLLVPALIVFIVGVTVALRVAWSRGARATAAVPVALGMTSFGLFFGRTDTSAPVVWGPITIPAPVEIAIGAMGLVLSVLWLTWCSHQDRASALQRAAMRSGVRLSRRRRASDSRRFALGAFMVIGPVALGALVAPGIAQGMTRDVLRSGVGPEVEVQAAISPLAEYRANFAEDRFDDVLFEVLVVDGALPDRVRVATLDFYDGKTYQVIDPAAPRDSTHFHRVPARVDAGEGERVRIDVEIVSLDGVWLPTVGRLVEASFAGPRSAALADGFYYNEALGAGVEIAGGGLREGDRYTLAAVIDDVPSLASLTAPGASAAVESPPHLRQWVAEHSRGEGGAALLGLVELLRERGYLSHSLAAPDGAEAPGWAADLAGYTFQPSPAGHSLARIDQIFERLIERERNAQGSGESLVAAVGDDEQFAVASALIAGELGFPSRVVVGANLQGPGEEPAVGSCAAGVCRAGDLSVWAEVQSADQQWVAIDVTPQHAVLPESDLTHQQDPKEPTEVRPDTAEAVSPPDPVQQDAASQTADASDREADLGALWAALRIGGLAFLALAVLIAPFLVVVAAKAMRRRARRTRTGAADRIAGGWEEYLDHAVDGGMPAPHALTRTEIATLYATPAAGQLATRADRAVFGSDAVAASEPDEFWRIVDDERRWIRRRMGIGKRVRAAVSLRSFTRTLASPRAMTKSERSPERRKRSSYDETRSI